MSEQAAELAELLDKFTRPDPVPVAGKQTEKS